MKLFNRRVPQGSKINLTGRTLAIYWRHVRAYRPFLILWAIGMLAAIAGDVLLPLGYKQFFDSLSVSVDLAHRAYRTPDLHASIVNIVVVTALYWVGWRLIVFSANHFENCTAKDLTDSCFEYLQHHSHHFFANNFAGALAKKVSRFASSFEVIADQCSFNTGQASIRIALIATVVLWRNCMLGIVFIGWIVVFLSFNVLFSRWKLRYDFARAEADSKVAAHLTDAITNATNLKLFCGIRREALAFKRVTGEHLSARYKSRILGLTSDTIQTFAVHLLQITVLLMALHYWYVGILTLGDFVMLRSYLDQITSNVTQMGSDIRHVYEAMADANEMTEILVKPHEVVNQLDARELTVSSTAPVEFRDVCFTYPDAIRETLTGFSLRIRAGERVGIAGPSGGGKSTIFKLFLRLYDVDSGAILINGQDISKVTQQSLHNTIAFVPQDPILLHRSLLENIRFSRPTASDEQVIQAACLAHCHEFISQFPLGYDTIVGERGIRLSGGERQRVAIARAILMGAPILIFDEATSSLDAVSEKCIQDALATLLEGRTVVAVAHRLSTIQQMDRIVVVKDGAIVEEGNHDTLLKMRNGLYQELWSV